MINFFNKRKSIAANKRYKYPSEKIKVIGVGGSYSTDIAAHMLYDILRNAGRKTGLILHNKNYRHGDIHSLINNMVNDGLEFAVLETNTDFLKRNFYEGIDFDSAILTNVTKTHPLNFRDWNEYVEMKLNFLNKIKDEGLIVINNNQDTISEWMNQNSNKIINNIFVHWVNINELSNLQYDLNNAIFEINEKRYFLPLIGPDAINTALSTIKLAQAYVHNDQINPSYDYIKDITKKMRILKREPYNVILDKADSPEVLEDILNYLSGLTGEDNKIITIMGIEGERDIDKKMFGNAAAKYSKLILLAANDPKSDFLYDINTEIQEGNGILVERIGSTEEYKILNKNNLLTKIERVINNGDPAFVTFDADDYTSRYDALDFAIKSAKSGDIILIIGKENEKIIIFDKLEYEWDDEIALKKIIESNNNI